jgi:UDP-N-acetylmuramyl pentapeptide phosphotransferase/UDP-N-acetylglucosamine-1-phosphate transferase
MMWLAPLSAFVVCWLLLAWLLRRGYRLPMDHPNARSLHMTPTPRIGGLGILAGVIVVAPWFFDGKLPPTVLAAFALAVVSVLDDVWDLPVVLRFLAHFAAALGCLLALGLSGLDLLLAILAVVWMTNLYNFMDGSDGLAGGMAAFGFSSLALAAWLSDALGLAVFCASVAAAALAFLRFNFPLARVFMGDAGSIPLGFLAATLGILGVLQNLWPMLFPLLVFSPFIVDASLTLLRRGIAREKVWQAHRSHYYQRLVRMGWSHRRLALGEYALMAASGVSGIAIVIQPNWQAGMVAAWLVCYAILAIIIDRRWKESGLVY